MSASNYLQIDIAINSKLNDKFIGKLSRQQIQTISRVQQISQDNIKRYINLLDKETICQYQKFTLQFILSNIKIFNVDSLQKNVYLQDQVRNRTGAQFSKFISDIRAMNYLLNGKKVPQQVIEQTDDPLLFQEANDQIDVAIDCEKILNESLISQFEKQIQKG